jgi:hypothetical protein
VHFSILALFLPYSPLPFHNAVTMELISGAFLWEDRQACGFGCSSTWHPAHRRTNEHLNFTLQGLLCQQGDFQHSQLSFHPLDLCGPNGLKGHPNNSPHKYEAK